jgi:DNA-binding CsgD family transcriptional regulator
MNAETNNNAIVATDNYFGSCPHCGAGLCVNVRKSHYGVCETHKVFWPFEQCRVLVESNEIPF